MLSHYNPTEKNQCYPYPLFSQFSALLWFFSVIFSVIYILLFSTPTIPSKWSTINLRGFCKMFTTKNFLFVHFKCVSITVLTVTLFILFICLLWCSFHAWTLLFFKLFCFVLLFVCLFVLFCFVLFFLMGTDVLCKLFLHYLIDYVCAYIVQRASSICYIMHAV